MSDGGVAKSNRRDSLRRRAEGNRPEGDGDATGGSLPDRQRTSGSGSRLPVALREPGAHGPCEPEPAKGTHVKRLSAVRPSAVWFSRIADAVGSESSGPPATSGNAARLRNVRSGKR